MKKLSFWLTLLISLSLVTLVAILLIGQLKDDAQSYTNPVYRAKVTEILYDFNPEDPEVQTLSVIFKAKITQGASQGTEVTCVQDLNSDFSYSTKHVAVGDKVLLQEAPTEDNPYWYFAEYIRSDYLIILAFVFFALLILFGRIKGIKTAISLLLTLLCVFLVFIPAILLAQNIFLWTFLSCLFIVVSTLLIVNGYSWLSLSSIMGCLLGIAISTILIVITETVVHLSGFVDEHSIYLSYLEIDVKGILYASMVIAAIGAIMDVAVNISAALHELAMKVDHITFSSLLSSGFTIGRDILGTMTNTLVLAYAGSSLASILLIVFYNYANPLYLFNQELVVYEVLQIIIGSTALLLTIPATAVISAFLFSRKSFQDKKRTTLNDSEPLDPYTESLIAEQNNPNKE